MRVFEERIGEGRNQNLKKGIGSGFGDRETGITEAENVDIVGQD